MPQTWPHTWLAPPVVPVVDHASQPCRLHRLAARRQLRADRPSRSLPGKRKRICRGTMGQLWCGQTPASASGPGALSAFKRSPRGRSRGQSCPLPSTKRGVVSRYDRSYWIWRRTLAWLAWVGAPRSRHHDVCASDQKHRKSCWNFSDGSSPERLG